MSLPRPICHEQFAYSVELGGYTDSFTGVNGRIVANTLAYRGRENAWPLNTAKSTPPIWLSRNEARQLFAPRFMSLYGTDSIGLLPPLLLLFSSLLLCPSPFLERNTLLLSRAFPFPPRSLTSFISDALVHPARNHFSHRNYTWPRNLSIIQSPGWLKKRSERESASSSCIF